jgi:hypothetical protein
MSIADTVRFWEILVIPVLQILEYTGYTSNCRYWKIPSTFSNFVANLPVSALLV